MYLGSIPENGGHPLTNDVIVGNTITLSAAGDGHSFFVSDDTSSKYINNEVQESLLFYGDLHDNDFEGNTAKKIDVNSNVTVNTIKCGARARVQRMCSLPRVVPCAAPVAVACAVCEAVRRAGRDCSAAPPPARILGLTFLRPPRLRPQGQHAHRHWGGRANKHRRHPSHHEQCGLQRL